MQKMKNGFTLVELLIVLALIGMFFAMTINFSLRNADRWALRDTARDITTTYYQAKQLASRENSPMCIDFEANQYVLYRRGAVAWEKLRSEPYPKHVTVSKAPTSNTGFAIAANGFIINPAEPLSMAIYTTQTITLTTPHWTEVDTMTITIYPYGGLRVDKAFK